MSNAKPIVVVGSCMIDFVTYAPRLPLPGETLQGSKLATNFGGKGANQCVAASKLGGKTSLIARVGDDSWGENYIENLKTLGVDTKHVQKTPESASGIAQITVSDKGENCIVIVPGANLKLSVQDVEKAKEEIVNAAVVVLQLETPVEVALKALQIAKGISILNGAPGLTQYDVRLLQLPTIFCVNESEAAAFSGRNVQTTEDAIAAARILISKGCQSVVLTLGENGAFYINKNKEELRISCPKVATVDTTGAGDAFIGSMAYLLANRSDLTMEKILKLSCAIASDTVTKPGTQISFPGPEILDKLKI